MVRGKVKKLKIMNKPDYKIKIDHEPVAKARPRFYNNRAYTCEKYRAKEAKIRSLIDSQYKRKPIQGAVRLELIFNIKRPNSVPISKREYPTVKPDLDNVSKCICDAMNKLVYADDSQIVSMNLIKRYGEVGSIEIKIWELVKEIDSKLC